MGDGLLLGTPDAQFNALDVLANPDNRQDMHTFSFFFVSESDLLTDSSENVDLRIHFISDALPVVATYPGALRVRPSAINLLLHKDMKVITIKAEQFFKQHIGDHPLLVSKVQNIRTALSQRERLFAVVSAASADAMDDGKMNTRVIDHMNAAGGPIMFSGASKDATATSLNESRLYRRFSDRTFNLLEDGMLKLNIPEVLSTYAMNSLTAISTDNDDGRAELFESLRHIDLFSVPANVARAVQGDWGTGPGQASLNSFGRVNEQVAWDSITPSAEATQQLFLERILVNFDNYLVFFYGKLWAGVGTAIMAIVKNRYSKHNIFVMSFLFDSMDKLLITFMKSVATKKFDTFSGQNLSNCDGVLAYFRFTFSDENLAIIFTSERQNLFLRDIPNALSWRRILSIAPSPDKKTKADDGLEPVSKKKAKKAKKAVAAGLPAPVLPAAPVMAAGGAAPISRVCAFQFLGFLGIKNTKGPFVGQVFKCTRGVCTFPHFAARPSKDECIAIAASALRDLILEHKTDVDAAIALLP